jgi:2,4-dienoyl-CoA reductase-like NADH-dependent reductase (Old Yellow Enzyme family)
MADLFSPLTFTSGATMKNRFMLAPLTNLQSHPDGVLSEDEYRWLTMRAMGGFGATMTCASHVQAAGKGFPGQLGCFSDNHLEGLTRLATGIREHGSLALLQLHHAGMRSPEEEIGQAPLCPSDNGETGARALSLEEVELLTEDFILAAERAERAGFDGVELHGAHGYILCQFLSPTINRRNDRYGGSLENRARIVLDIIDGVRRRCRPDFALGLRLSPERFDIRLAEMQELAGELFKQGKIDFLDMSLWDSFKAPDEEGFKGRTLLSCFTDLNRGPVRLGTAGKIRNAETARRCLEAGADFVLPGRAAILHHDFPEQVAANDQFEPISIPVSRDYLESQGLGPAFVDYMASWKGFVEEQAEA